VAPKLLFHADWQTEGRTDVLKWRN